MRSVLVVLQARVGSSRLPGKVLQHIGDRSIVAHCLTRLTAARTGLVVLATTTGSVDDAVAAVGSGLGVPVVRGDEQDVLGRFVDALDAFPADIVVRATADNPAVDVEAAGRTVHALLATGADYCCESGLPIGTAVEAVRREVLLDAHRRADAPFDREHVTTSIKRDTARYRVAYPPAPRKVHRPDLRFTVDTPDDLAWIRQIAAELPEPLARAPLSSVIHAADALAACRGAA